MIEAYKQQAREEAIERIARGCDPRSLVHVVEYPADHYLYGVEYQHLSSPLPPNSDLAGHLCKYYTLGELAKLDEE